MPPAAADPTALAQLETREARPDTRRPRVGFELHDRAAWSGGWIGWIGDCYEATRERAALIADRLRERLADASRAESSIWRTFAARLAVVTSEPELRSLLVETAARLAGVAPERVELIATGSAGVDRHVYALAGDDAHALVIRHGTRDLALLRVATVGSRRHRAEVQRRLQALATLAAFAWVAPRGSATGDGRFALTPGRDDATGLPDARAFEQFLSAAFEQARRVRGKLAVLVIRPAQIDAIRADDGSVFADAAIGLAARAVRATVRASDPVARLGDDTLAVLLAGASESNARRIADALLRAIAEAGQTASSPTPLTATVGLAAFPGAATTPSGLLDRARQSSLLPTASSKDDLTPDRHEVLGIA